MRRYEFFPALVLALVVAGCDGCSRQAVPVEEIVFDSSEVFRSPSGRYAASVSGWRSSKGTAQSQASVDEGTGGSGLIAFPVARVDMAFEWRSDEHLVVRYPDDLPRPRIDATNTSFGLGGRGRVEYVATPRAEISALEWTTSVGALRLLAEQELERGRIVTHEHQGEVTYSYSYYDTSAQDSSVDLLLEAGWQGGGYSWEGIIYGLVALRAPHISEQLRYNPEGDGLSVESSQLPPLLKVAELVAEAKRDPALLQAAISRASQDGRME